MLDLARKVTAKIVGAPREKFEQDENLRLALAHLLQTIGEAARRVSREFQKAHPEIPWSGIVGMVRATNPSEKVAIAPPQPFRAAAISALSRWARGHDARSLQRYAAAASRVRSESRTDTSFETPGSSIVTP
ncbi:MAG TPA: HepT-like ribonuclease domain-containing protein [Anaeromyxobacter sp.]